MVRTLGFPYAFRAKPWSEIEAGLDRIAQAHEQFRHMADLARSVIESPARNQLAGTTSMHDILVALAPVGEPPIDIIVVRAPGSLHEAPSGKVRIEHLSVSGRNDTIDRPVADTIPLFWRFVIEKFGVSPT